MGLGLGYLVDEAVDERRERDHVELQVRRLELDLLEGLQRLRHEAPAHAAAQPGVERHLVRVRVGVGVGVRVGVGLGLGLGLGVERHRVDPALCAQLRPQP